MSQIFQAFKKKAPRCPIRSFLQTETGRVLKLCFGDFRCSGVAMSNGYSTLTFPLASLRYGHYHVSVEMPRVAQPSTLVAPRSSPFRLHSQMPFSGFQSTLWPFFLFRNKKSLDSYSITTSTAFLRASV